MKQGVLKYQFPFCNREVYRRIIAARQSEVQ